ncbi:hypothetical protein EJB05_30362 [Eragrostis curvula]|uniref:Bifunctional inhibitor/plant lipid transfer protein/seed storage helical domain-containing protein n=1 Tax=Eragrostis curvula TaxID=38414 RepID=A0A5J9UB44_9POAL|nr:hypothetical protein EJB05_30362 [Eragrostis curvula]
MAYQKGVLLLLAVTMNLTLLNFHLAFAQLEWDLAKLDLLRDCWYTIHNEPNGVLSPSPTCCKTIKREDIDGVCEHLTPTDQETINARKLVDATMACGKSFKTTTKYCGKFKIPPTADNYDTFQAIRGRL